MQNPPPGKPVPPGQKTTGSIPQQPKPAAPKPGGASFDADEFLILDAAPAKPAAPPAKTGATGSLPAAVGAPKTGTTGAVPAAGVPKTGATGKVPTAVVPAVKTGTTSRVPTVTAPPKTGATGAVPAAGAPKTGTTGKIPTVVGPARTGTTGTLPVTGRPGSSGRIPKVGGKTTGSIPKLTDTGRLRTTGSIKKTGKTGMTGRTGTVAQRMQKQSKKALRKFQAAAALAGLVLVIAGAAALMPKGKGPDPKDLIEIENLITDALRAFDAKKYKEADDICHKLEPKIKAVGTVEKEEFKEAVRKITAYHQSEIHPTAAAEGDAERAFSTWLPKVDEFLKTPEPRDKAEGIRLFDLGEPNHAKYPRYSRADEITKKLEELEKYKLDDAGGDESTKVYQSIAAEIRKMLKDKMFGAAVERWKTGKADPKITDAKIKGQIDDQVAKVLEQAKLQLDKWTREAEQKRDDLSDRAGGLKVLDEARARIKGLADLEKDLEERIKGYNEGKKFGG